MTLQPLRIPAGWTVEYNDFTSSDESNDLKEDLLQLYHARENRLIDLGWYRGDGEEKGAYLILVFEGDFEGKCLAEFKSEDRDEIVAELERLLALPA